VSEDGVEMVGVRRSSGFIDGRGVVNVGGVEVINGFEGDGRASVARRVRGLDVPGSRKLFAKLSISVDRSSGLLG
jgi:hypothetical protein